MDLLSSVADFLQPHCFREAGEPGRNLTCRIGPTKERARTWSYDRLDLTGATSSAVAREAVDRLGSERRTKPTNAYFEVYVKTGTHPIACLGPVALAAADRESEDGTSDLEDALSDGSYQRVVAVLVGSLDRRADRDDRRIAHLETMLSAAHKGALESAVQLAEARAQVAAADVDGMGAAVGALAPIVGPALADLVERFRPGPPPATATATATPTEPSDPGADVDAYLGGLAATLAQHPEVVTPARWASLKGAWGQVAAIAAARGLS